MTGLYQRDALDELLAELPAIAEQRRQVKDILAVLARARVILTRVQAGQLGSVRVVCVCVCVVLRLIEGSVLRLLSTFLSIFSLSARLRGVCGVFVCGTCLASFLRALGGIASWAGCGVGVAARGRGGSRQSLFTHTSLARKLSWRRAHDDPAPPSSAAATSRQRPPHETGARETPRGNTHVGVSRFPLPSAAHRHP